MMARPFQQLQQQQQQQRRRRDARQLSSRPPTAPARAQRPRPLPPLVVTVASAAAQAAPPDSSSSGGSSSRNGASPSQSPPSPPLSHKEGKVLHPDLLNERLKKTQYAVRGELYVRAEELRSQGREIIFTNIGNPHQLGAKPITFVRQVIALVAAPFLLDDPRALELFPADAIERAHTLHQAFDGGVGAYQDSRGNAHVRGEVARFIEARDGVGPTNPDHIFLTDGASPAVRRCLSALIRDDRDGVLVPIPQYPLYSASIQLYGGALLPYELDEASNWGLSVESIRESMNAARAEGKAVRGLVFINPGNPTGQCLTYDNLVELVKLAYEEKVVLMADEVYQENVYQDERPFVSARKVVKEMGEPYASGVELLSFHTVSKGASGECGLRGGYVELTNLHPRTVDELYKISGINLAPNGVGQVAVSCLVNPPKEGDPSHEQHQRERLAELASLRRRAQLVTDAFNSLEGVTANYTEGAMYSFPQLRLPPKAIAAAEAAGKVPDVFYCLRLLEATGISAVPGSGFGQAEGTFHLRTTILPREEKMAQFVDKFSTFHRSFMAEFS